MTTGSRVRYRFGRFELDLEGRQLLENGKRLHTPAQAIRLLELLVTHADRLVTRQQVREILWTPGTHVDFEHGINSAVRRLRSLLGDTDANPCIATVTGQGYRFVAPLEVVYEGEAPAASRRRGRGWRWVWVGAAVAGLWAVSGWVWPVETGGPAISAVRPVTTDGGLDVAARPASAGGLIYYLDRAGGSWDLMRSDGNPAAAQRVAPRFAKLNMRLMDISSRGEWLLGSFAQRGTELTLWRQPAAGGALVRVGNIAAYDAVWSRDGRTIFYGSGDGLWRAAADGSHPQRLARVPLTPDWLALAPDGERLRFTSSDAARGVQAIWEWRPGQAARELAAAAPRCCGGWSRDGRYYLYSEMHGGAWQIWAERAGGWQAWMWPWLRGRARQLTFESRSSWGAYTGFGRGTLVFYEQDPHVDTVRYAPGAQRTLPLLAGRSAIRATYSGDGRHVAYVDTRDFSIWAADVDAGMLASHFRQLSPAGMRAQAPSWAPGGARLAFQAQGAGPGAGVYTVAATGGPAQALVPAQPRLSALEPAWSPDGRRLAVQLAVGESSDIAIVDASSGALQPLPGSAPYGNMAWSPDGRWLAAASSDQHAIALYSFAAERWRVVARGRGFGGPHWGRDGAVYFQDLLAPGEPLYRFRPAAAAPERVADFDALVAAGVHRCGFAGFAPDGTLLLELRRGAANLDAATLRLP